ncbi:carbohydrate ABC transporter permease [Ruania alba]|uniref:Multiple sugar transport system permease protein n=1 Tax=Ruania alba TaxID=648782 RepID=A0A1H5DGV2_9MICO|nr:carbohydrate ABC transporter permease [Ruania alba]SED78153.1 multiple sugar transport system permease protein [Ruania alba]
MRVTKLEERSVPVRRIAIYVALCAGLVVMLYPLTWMLSASVKAETDIFTEASLWPTEWDLGNYTDGWWQMEYPFGVFFTNSFVISALAIIGNLISCSMAAYAFARLDFRAKRWLFASMLVTIMLPFHVTVVPQYVLFSSLDLINTIVPLALPKFLAVDAFFIFLMVQFIRGIPREYDEAAAVDGCSPVHIFRRIILPLSLPALLTTAIFTFLWTWNDFFSQLIYLSSQSNYTVPLALRLFIDSTGGESAWGPLMAMAVLSLIPVLVVFAIFQRMLVDGVAASGIKG